MYTDEHVELSSVTVCTKCLLVRSGEKNPEGTHESRKHGEILWYVHTITTFSVKNLSSSFKEKKVGLYSNQCACSNTLFIKRFKN